MLSEPKAWPFADSHSVQREEFPVKKTLPHRNILLSLFGSLFIFHVQRRSRLDYVAYRRRCPTIIYIDSHSASIKERRKISYSQTPPLPCPVALRGVAYKIGAEAKGKYISPSPLPCPVAFRGVSVMEYSGSARRAKWLKQKQ